jgi:hypothetical protein
LIDNELPDETSGVAASGQRRSDAAGQQLVSNDAPLVLPALGSAVPLSCDVVRIAEAWPSNPPHIREANLTLVDVAIQQRRIRSPDCRKIDELTAPPKDRIGL